MLRSAQTQASLPLRVLNGVLCSSIVLLVLSCSPYSEFKFNLSSSAQVEVW